VDQIKYGSVDRTLPKHFCIAQTDQLEATQVLPDTETHGHTSTSHKPNVLPYSGNDSADIKSPLLIAGPETDNA